MPILTNSYATFEIIKDPAQTAASLFDHRALSVSPPLSLSPTQLPSPYLSFCGLQIHKELTVSAECVFSLIGPEEGVEVNRGLQRHRESVYNRKSEATQKAECM